MNMSDRGQDMEKPAPPPEAVLIRLTRQASRIRTPAAAAAAGISTARWSQIENGYETRGGRYKPVSAPAQTIAWMAHVVGVEASRLEAVRPDAAVILREIQRLSAAPAGPEEAPGPQGALTPDEERSVKAFLAALRHEAADSRDDGDRLA